MRLSTKASLGQMAHRLEGFRNEELGPAGAFAEWRAAVPINAHDFSHPYAVTIVVA
jgi:hypothetical protein